MLLAILGKVQSVAEELPHRDRKRHQILLAAPNPEERFLRIVHFSIIPEQVLTIGEPNRKETVQCLFWPLEAPYCGL